MAGRPSFKSDESFLEKISMGAAGTGQVFKDLQKQGHRPLELERGSMSFKIWKTIKIKRLRVPDLMCVNCGRRIESRAKASLEISMSHSLSDPERAWDSGLDNEDRIAFIVCRKISEKPVDWQAEESVQYVLVSELRFAQKNERAILIRPKGVEEGFESRVNWPAVIAHAPGFITQITSERIQYQRQSDHRTISLRLARKGVSVTPLVSVGDRISEHQVIAAVVPISPKFLCDRAISEDHYLDLLSNSAPSKRYAAAKALSFFASGRAPQPLANRLSDADEHIYVRLEAAASLTRLGNDSGLAFIKSCLADSPLENRLEAVIVLGEIVTDSANTLLIDTLLNAQQHPEIRAGAAWALGEHHNQASMSALIDSFLAVDKVIRVEAARALTKLASQLTPDIIKQFRASPPQKRPGISWALSKSGRFTLQEMLDSLVDDDTRQWVAYILGTQDQQRFLHEIERLKARDPEVYFAVTVLWKIMTNWIYGLEEY
jgi:hypothetical protein